MTDTSPSVWPGDPEQVHDASSAQLSLIKKSQASQMMATLSGICSESSNSSEETCSLKGAQFFQITQREETPCAETTTCSVCDVFSLHLGLCALMAGAHSSKNSRMNQLLASSTALHQAYTLAMPCQLSSAERVQRKTKVKDLLCKIFDCKRNRLQCMKHIG